MEDDGDYACQNKFQRANQIVHVNKAEAQKSSSASLLLSTVSFLFSFLVL